MIDMISEWLLAIHPDDKREKAYKVIETIELEVAVMYLQTHYLEKKLMGVQILIQRVFSAKQLTAVEDTQQRVESRRDDIMVNHRWLNVAKLVEFFDKIKIFEIIFGESLHNEVVKKSLPLLDFLYSN